MRMRPIRSASTLPRSYLRCAPRTRTGAPLRAVWSSPSSHPMLRTRPARRPSVRSLSVPARHRCAAAVWPQPIHPVSAGADRSAVLRPPGVGKARATILPLRALLWARRPPRLRAVRPEAPPSHRAPTPRKSLWRCLRCERRRHCLLRVQSLHAKSSQWELGESQHSKETAPEKAKSRNATHFSRFLSNPGAATAASPGPGPGTAATLYIPLPHYGGRPELRFWGSSNTGPSRARAWPAWRPPRRWACASPPSGSPTPMGPAIPSNPDRADRETSGEAAPGPGPLPRTPEPPPEPGPRRTGRGTSATGFVGEVAQWGAASGSRCKTPRGPAASMMEAAFVSGTSAASPWRGPGQARSGPTSRC